MTRMFLVVIVALAGAMTTIHEALARPVGPHAVPKRTFTQLERRYLTLYHEAVRRNGDRAPGRNIVRHGLRDGQSPDHARLARSVRVLERMLAPPPVAAPAAAPVASAASTATVTPASTGMPSCTWAPESGGSYTAVNPSSGAGGKYQIMPSTWKAYGGVEANAADAPPAEQDAVAERVLAGQGPSAWVNC